jgi:hypothetical protein
MRTNIARCALLLLAVAGLVPGREASAQLGGLIKRGAGQAASAAVPAPPSVGEPVAFDDVVLELTSERLAKIAAGKAAARKIAEGRDGPAAIRKRIDPLDERQMAIYSKHVEEINAWDEKRRDAERCRDSVLTEVQDRKRTQTGAEFLQRYQEIGMQMAVAQQKGDTVEIQRLTARMKSMQEPTRADTLAAERSCGAPAPPKVVQEWLDLKSELEALQEQLAQAEQAVRDAEERESGMNHRQLAIACERIKMYIDRAEAKQRQQGFTQAELDALGQARAELKRICEA